MIMKTPVILIGCTSIVAAIVTVCVNGYHFLQSLPSVKSVPIWQTQPLPPLDYKALSKGKVTHYFPSPETPNSPSQEAMLEACGELPIHGATARSASVVIATHEYGKMPVEALVVGNTVLVDQSQVIRALRAEFGIGRTEEVLYSCSPASIALTIGNKWAVVGNKKVVLQLPTIGPSSGGIVMALPDILAVFHERDVQLGGLPTIQSAEVSYEPHSYKLYSH